MVHGAGVDRDVVPLEDGARRPVLTGTNTNGGTVDIFSLYIVGLGGVTGDGLRVAGNVHTSGIRGPGRYGHEI